MQHISPRAQPGYINVFVVSAGVYKVHGIVYCPVYSGVILLRGPVQAAAVGVAVHWSSCSGIVSDREFQLRVLAGCSSGERWVAWLVGIGRACFAGADLLWALYGNFF